MFPRLSKWGQSRETEAGSLWAKPFKHCLWLRSRSLTKRFPFFAPVPAAFGQRFKGQLQRAIWFVLGIDFLCQGYCLGTPMYYSRFLMLLESWKPWAAHYTDWSSPKVARVTAEPAGPHPLPSQSQGLLQHRSFVEECRATGHLCNRCQEVVSVLHHSPRVWIPELHRLPERLAPHRLLPSWCVTLLVLSWAGNIPFGAEKCPVVPAGKRGVGSSEKAVCPCVCSGGRERWVGRKAKGKSSWRCLIPVSREDAEPWHWSAEVIIAHE